MKTKTQNKLLKHSVEKQKLENTLTKYAKKHGIASLADTIVDVLDKLDRMKKETVSG